MSRVMGLPSCLAIRYKSGIRSLRIFGEYMGLLSSNCPKGFMAAGVKPKRKTQLTGVGLFAVMGKCLLSVLRGSFWFVMWRVCVAGARLSLFQVFIPPPPPIIDRERVKWLLSNRFKRSFTSDGLTLTFARQLRTGRPSLSQWMSRPLVVFKL